MFSLVSKTVCELQKAPLPKDNETSVGVKYEYVSKRINCVPKVSKI